jgi:hypothetical protein
MITLYLIESVQNDDTTSKCPVHNNADVAFEGETTTIEGKRERKQPECRLTTTQPSTVPRMGPAYKRRETLFVF